MKLIIIEGATSTGKSTLACRLAADLKLPLTMKDGYKERVFDSLSGLPTLRQVYQIENDSWREIFKAVRKAVAAKTSIIVEGNFWRSHRSAFRQIIEPDVKVAEVYCFARGRTILKRFIGRNRRGERHAGHRDKLFYISMVLMVPFMWTEKHFRPLRLTPNLLMVNTSDFAKLDIESIETFINKV